MSAQQNFLSGIDATLAHVPRKDIDELRYYTGTAIAGLQRARQGSKGHESHSLSSTLAVSISDT